MVGKTGWRQPPIAGGYCINMSCDLTFSSVLLGTDVGGLYLRNFTAGQWEQQFTPETLPAGVWDNSISPGGNAYSNAAGCFYGAVAPNNPNRAYVWCNGYLLKGTKTDGRFIWTKTGLNGGNQMKAFSNGTHARYCGPKIAIDDLDDNVVYVGTMEDGLHQSLNGGDTFTKRTDVPNSLGGDNNKLVSIVIDRSSAATSGRRSRVVVYSYGNGSYVSTNGGPNFAAISGSPTDIAWQAIDGNGKVYQTDQTGGLKRILANNTVETVTVPGLVWHTVAIAPDNKRIIVHDTNGAACQAVDITGAGFGEVYYSGYPSPVGWDKTAPATDVPWTAKDLLINPGCTIFNPTQTKELWMAMGIGAMKITLPDAFTTLHYTMVCKGIEMICAKDIITPPNSPPLLVGQDRPCFQMVSPDHAPYRYGPKMTSEGVALHHGWGGDFAGNNGDFVAILANYFTTSSSGYSLQGGRPGTWINFANEPSPGDGGMIACSTDQIMLATASDNSDPVWTRNRFDSPPTALILPSPGLPPGGAENGFGFYSYVNNNKIVTADKTVPGRFYLHNYGPADPTYASLMGIYQVDIGPSGPPVVTKKNNTRVANSALVHVQLKAVPGYTGHLILCAGDVGGVSNPADTDFVRSTDGGVTFNPLDVLIKEVKCFGFGPPAPGQSYPSILFAGYYNGVFGLYLLPYPGAAVQAIDATGFPSIDVITAISGVPGHYGHAIVGFLGTGFAYLGNRACSRMYPLAA